ncbi:glycosyltransferase [Skermanella mucosa]|uniref:glycosyltransferase n=1 Tax=Skermanella mucosa TaxID=1789672 RepID=UPI00192B7FBE|nr:glycosyltransferase [Skermanella mucosa]UEM20070.1 glycosyltransferase [Skermanella mucosa]
MVSASGRDGEERSDRDPLKVLILSWYFPPSNTIGAIRVGKLAKYLMRRHVDVRVVTAREPDLAKTLPLEIPPERVVYTRAVDVNRPIDVVGNLRNRLLRRTPAPGGGASAGAGGGVGGGRGTLVGRVLSTVSDFYLNLSNLPDRYVGWLPWAVAGARRTCRDWKPDLIYVTGPPFTAFLAGHHLSAKLGVPWIAEFRDRWADDPYFEAPDWRMALLDRMERRVAGSASGIVTVSEPWTEFYRAKYGKPVATIYNGYDPQDFPLPTEPPPASPDLTITYAGVLYSGRRDPSPLFQALALLGPERERVRIEFYGSDPGLVFPPAERAGVTDRVAVHPAVPYKRSLEIQRRSDVLLLLQWNNPREQGNVPAKLFEYFGVLRPILGIGLEDGVPARLIRERQAGFFSNDPQAIADQIRRWLAAKDAAGGRLERLPPSAREGLSRDIQFERLLDFCAKVIQPAAADCATRKPRDA